MPNTHATRTHVEVELWMCHWYHNELHNVTQYTVDATKVREAHRWNRLPLRCSSRGCYCCATLAAPAAAALLSLKGCFSGRGDFLLGTCSGQGGTKVATILEREVRSRWGPAQQVAHLRHATASGCALRGRCSSCCRCRVWLARGGCLSIPCIQGAIEHGACGAWCHCGNHR